MSQKCEICGKGPMFGHNVSHAHNKTRKKFSPNLKKRRIVVEGRKKRVLICTRCLRTAMLKG